jgi:hypothetical protein
MEAKDHDIFTLADRVNEARAGTSPSPTRAVY